MIFKNNEKYYIGSNNSKFLFSVDELEKVEMNNDEREECEELNQKISYLVESQSRFLRLIEFINTSNIKDLKLFGRIYNMVGPKKDIKILKSEFYADSLEKLEATISRTTENNLIEVILLDDSISIIDVLSVIRFQKAKYDIYTTFDISMDDKFSNSYTIRQLEIPSYFKNLFISKKA